MADISFKSVVISFLVAGLFIIAISQFGALTAINYGFNESLMDVPGLDIDLITEEINTTSTGTSGSWETSYTNATSPFPEEGEDVSFLTFTSLWDITKSMWSATKTIFNFTFDSAAKILGIPKIVLSLLLTILIIVMMFSLWRLIRIGG